MGKFLSLTGSAHAAGTSKISGELLEDIEYSQIGLKQIKPCESMIQNQFVAKAERFSAESLRALQSDWDEVSLDFLQIGLTVVGLIEVAEPVQIAADVANGAIDIKRGHPYIGALSIASAIPLAGLFPGALLTVLRAFKCVYSGLKCLGRCFIVLAVKSVTIPMKFIYLRRGTILNYCQNAKRFIMNTGEKIIEGFPLVTEKVLKNIRDFGEQMAKQRVTQNSIISESSKALDLHKSYNNIIEANKKVINSTIFNRTGPYNPLNVFRR